MTTDTDTMTEPEAAARAVYSAEAKIRRLAREQEQAEDDLRWAEEAEKTYRPVRPTARYQGARAILWQSASRVVAAQAELRAAVTRAQAAHKRDATDASVRTSWGWCSMADLDIQEAGIDLDLNTPWETRLWAAVKEEVARRLDLALATWLPTALAAADVDGGLVEVSADEHWRLDSPANGPYREITVTAVRCPPGWPVDIRTHVRRDAEAVLEDGADDIEDALIPHLEPDPEPEDDEPEESPHAVVRWAQEDAREAAREAAREDGGAR